MAVRWEAFIQRVGHVLGCWLAFWAIFNYAVPIVVVFLAAGVEVAGIDTIWVYIEQGDLEGPIYQRTLCATALLAAIIAVTSYRMASEKATEEKMEQVQLLICWTDFLADKYGFEAPDENKEPFQDDFAKFQESWDGRWHAIARWQTMDKSHKRSVD